MASTRRSRARKAALGSRSATLGGVAAGIGVLLVAGAAALAVKSSLQRAEAATVHVYQAPSCGCCEAWVGHLRRLGFEVEVEDAANLQAVKARHGVPLELGSCHTATVDRYVVEGHVPGDLVARLLDERPRIAGLAVPGMPAGSPGMEGAGREPYQVLAFDRRGIVAVYARR